MSKDLRTVVVIDYQNVHLTGHGLFSSTRYLPKHETLVDPLLFARVLLRERNARQRPDQQWRNTPQGARVSGAAFERTRLRRLRQEPRSAVAMAAGPAC